MVVAVAVCKKLSGPISRDTAILSLRYPPSRDTFSAIPAMPQQGAIPPYGALLYTDISVRYPMLQHIARYLCDTPGKQPKEPVRTKNTTALNSVVFCYRRSFFTICSDLLLNSLKNGGFKESTVVFYYRRSVFTMDSKFTIRTVFSTGGSFGKHEKVLRDYR